MEREDLYYLKQHDIDASFLSIVSGGGALAVPSPAPAPVGSPPAAAPRTTPYRFRCGLCGFHQEVVDPKAVIWCSHKGRADNNKPCVMKKVDR